MSWASIAGVSALVAGALLAFAFAAMCRHSDQQEPHDERHDDFI